MMVSVVPPRRPRARALIYAVRLDEVEIDLDADPGLARDRHGAVFLEVEAGLRDAARELALADVEFDEAGARQGGDELEAVAGEQVRQPGMRHQVDAGALRHPRHLGRDGDAAAARDVRLDDVDAA